MKSPGEHRRPKLGAWGGFTLIELLTAAAITLLLAGMIVSVISDVLGKWSRTHGTFAADSQARQVLDQIEQDLQGALYRDDGNTWLAATVQPESGVSGAWVGSTKPVAASLNPAAADLAAARFGAAGVWLRFFTAVGHGDASAPELSAPAAVSYQIIHRAPTPAGSEARYLLYRSAVTPAATFAAGFDLGSARYNPGSESIGAAGSLVTPGVLQVMAEDVIDFGVRFHGYEADPVSGLVQLRRIFAVDSTDLEYRANASPGTRHQLPVTADVMLRVLTPEGARQIAALEAGRITGDWWKIATANSRVMTRHIHLQAGSR
jgi:hypothetical protein